MKLIIFIFGLCVFLQLSGGTPVHARLEPVEKKMIEYLLENQTTAELFSRYAEEMNNTAFF